MSLLPRRARADHSGQVAVHPGWTLSPPTAESIGHEAEAAASVPLPASRWTSSPPLPAVLGGPAAPATSAAPAAPAVEAFSFWVDAPAAPIATVLSAPLPLPLVPEPVVPQAVVSQPVVPQAVALQAVPPQPVVSAVSAQPAMPVPSQPEPAQPSWTSEWEAVAATAPTAGPTALHTGPAVAPMPSTAQPLEPPPMVAVPVAVPLVVPLVVPPAPAPAPAVAALTALDRPLPVDGFVAETPLAAQAVAFLQAAAPVIPAPPTSPPRTLPPSSPAQQIVDRAMRSAPTAAVRRSTVRLGFTDASVVDLRPDDPMAKALHTVADALIGRDLR